MKNTTIKFKIIMYNTCMICIVGVIFSISSYVTANQKAIQIAQNSIEYHVESIARYYQQAYEQMIHLVLNCAERETFDLQALGDLGAQEEKALGLDYARQAQNFCSITGYGSYISRLAIFDDGDIHISAGTALSSVDDGRRIRHADWFQAEVEKDMYLYRLDLVPSPFYKEEGNMLPIVCKNSGFQKNDWTTLALSPDLYQDKLAEDDNGNLVLVTTYRGQRIASIREDSINHENSDLVKRILSETEDTGVKHETIDGKNCMIVYHKAFRSGIVVVEVMDMESLKNDQRVLLQTVFFIFTCCVLLGVMLSYIFSNAVKNPIDRLVTHVGTIATGDFCPDYTMESDDEIGLIGKAVNSMSSQIERLMDKRLEDEKEKSSLELKMLQAQINPHFLYNTLDSIKWIAVIQKNSGIVKAVTALSKLLKNMAKGVDEQITLREELDFVHDYVTIEKLKYAEMFDLKVDVCQEWLYQAKIVKLTLQPLVENSIFSGIEPGGKNGNILIRAYCDETCLYIDVRDDGVGISKEMIPHLLDHTETLKGDRMSSIGMPNVDRRIKLLYGEEYGLSVESAVGEYTQVTVKVPLKY